MSKQEKNEIRKTMLHRLKNLGEGERRLMQERLTAQLLRFLQQQSGLWGFYFPLPEEPNPLLAGLEVVDTIPQDLAQEFLPSQFAKTSGRDAGHFSHKGDDNSSPEFFAYSKSKDVEALSTSRAKFRLDWAFPVMSAGASVALTSAQEGLKFYRPEFGFIMGPYGVRQPKLGGQKALAPEDFSGFIVPGLAFSKKGERLGRGKGFYDQLLTKGQGVFVGLAFDCQILAQLPVESHDIKMHRLISESGILDFQKGTN